MTPRRSTPDGPAGPAGPEGPDLPNGSHGDPAPASQPAPLTVTLRGWAPDPDEPLRAIAAEPLTAPRMKLAFAEPAAGPVTVAMTLATAGIETLLVRAGMGKGREERAWISLEDPSLVHHEFPWLEVLADPASGTCSLEFDLAPRPDRALRWISLEPGEVRNWRLHPGFPGGAWFRAQASVPAGAMLWVAEFSVAARERERSSPAWQGALNWSPPAPRQAADPRDAIIFSSWVPEQALPLGQYFLDVLKRRHPGARCFFGINHGSSPDWERMIRDSGLDAVAAHAAPGVTMPYDPSGFIAALDAYRRSDERFRLAWFGHTKGGLHPGVARYGEARWAIERWFWSAGEEVDRAFSRDDVGVWAPHWLMFQPEHLEQTNALRRMYDAPCAPLGAMAVSAHFVLRDDCLRDFVRRVDPRLFTAGVEPFGGDRYFFEFAAPNIPLVQGWSAAGPEGEGGSSGMPGCGASAAILNDWRQNNAMMRCELERWRQDPLRFVPRPVEHRTMWGPPGA
ncbi:MAG: hypothetical protein ACKOWF_05805 [Chloroflexota bacterium]